MVDVLDIKSIDFIHSPNVKKIVTYGESETTFSFSRFKVDKLNIIFYGENDKDILEVDIRKAIRHNTVHITEFLKEFGVDALSTNMKIIRRYLRGYCQKAIARELNVSTAKVSVLLKKYGLTDRIPYEPIEDKEERGRFNW